MVTRHDSTSHPGKSTMKIEAFQEGDADYQIRLADGRVLPGGRTIAEWRKILKGDEGEVEEYENKHTYHLSLKPYARLDPNKTRLAIVFVFPLDPSKGPEKELPKDAQTSTSGKKLIAVGEA